MILHFWLTFFACVENIGKEKGKQHIWSQVSSSEAQEVGCTEIELEPQSIQLGLQRRR